MLIIDIMYNAIYAYDRHLQTTFMNKLGLVNKANISYWLENILNYWYGIQPKAKIKTSEF